MESWKLLLDGHFSRIKLDQPSYTQSSNELCYWLVTHVEPGHVSFGVLHHQFTSPKWPEPWLIRRSKCCGFLFADTVGVYNFTARWSDVPNVVANCSYV